MAQRRSRESRSTAFNARKFVSAAAQERYTNGLLTKASITERGFDMDDGEMRSFIRTIRRHRWESFCAQPETAVIPVVREFYANLPEHQAGKVMVRGRMVPVSSHDIDAFYQLPMREDIASFYQVDDVTDDNIIHELTEARARWRIHNGEVTTFKASKMTVPAKMWHMFVAARLLPCSHTSNISRARAALIFCILTGRRIYVGNIIHAAMTNAAAHPREGLWFPSLITALCARAGVGWTPDEELLHPKSPLNAHVLGRIYRNESRARETSPPPPVPGASASSQSPPFLPAPGGPSSSHVPPLSSLHVSPPAVDPALMALVSSIARRQRRMERYQHRHNVYQEQYNVRLEMLFQAVANGPRVDLSHLPPMPVPPPHNVSEESSEEEDYDQ